MNTFPHPAAPRLASFWQRLLDTVLDGRRAAAERVWADLAVRSGGRLTDDLERQIGLHL